ncbi:MAG: hypothetical protein KKB31_04800 [Nanoarchaeota archaeon]|nr:hypothetical protein [Nanoarchaeota archaeon]
MAYILGFTCADGNVHEKTLSWDLSNKFVSNLELLHSFNGAMLSNYPILKRPGSYRLRISHVDILKDIKELGIVPNKKKILIFPDVPLVYLRHFMRGFLDGDGWIITRVRKNGGKEICVGFSNGSYNFMKVLVDLLKKTLDIDRFNLRKRRAITKKGKIVFTYQLEFYSYNANKIIEFLYGSLNAEDLRLRRKYERVAKANLFFEEEEKIKKLGRKWHELESKLGEDMLKLIENSLYSDKLIPREIANQLGISLSTLYRWMDKAKIRVFERRGSVGWSKRIIESRNLILKNGQ